MKIRIEKIEIEVPREFVETISNGVLRLKNFDAEMDARTDNAKQSMMMGLLAAGINMMRDSFRSSPVEKPKEDGASAPEAGGESA